MALSIPGLTLREEVGRGASSVVYRAERDGEQYAVKVRNEPLRADNDNDAQRFYREASVLACLRSPSLETIFTVGESSGRLFLVKELVEGRTLSERVCGRPMPEDEVVRLCLSVASALDVLHRRGLVHRDVKPDNVLLDPDGRAKLVDLGFVARAGAEGVAGTPMYSAPEQTGMLKRPVDPRSDLYSLGVLLFECATGRPPFLTDDVAELIRLHAARPAPAVRELRPDVSVVFAAIIAKLLAKDPDDRYQSAGSLIADLRDLSGLNQAAALGGKLALGTSEAAAAGEDDLVGPAAEALMRLQQLWRTSDGTSVSVVGPPGSGRSQLLASTQRWVTAQGGLCLHVQGSQGARPFAPLKDALQDCALAMDRLPADRRRELLKRFRHATSGRAGWLRELSPLLAQRLGPEASQEEGELNHEQFLDLFASFLLRLGRGGRALLAVDGAHLLDSATQQVLKRVADGLEGSGVLVVGTSDPDSAVEWNDWVSSGQQVELGPLLHDDVHVLVERLLAGPPPEHLVDELRARSDGTPAAIIELVRAMLDGGVLRPDWGSWTIDRDALSGLKLPSGMLEALQQSAATLPPRTRQALCLAALLGQRFAARLLGQILEMDTEQVHTDLADAVAGRLIVRRGGGRYAFADDRLREALVAGLDPAHNRKLNQRAADVLQAATDDHSDRVYAVADHLLAGEVDSDPGRVFQAQKEAGRVALKRHAVKEAIAFLERGVQLAVEHNLPLGRDTNRSLGDAYYLVGRYSDAMQQMQRALEATHDCTERAEVRVRRANVYMAVIDATHARAELLDALQDLGAPLSRWSIVQAVTTLWSWVVALGIGWTGWGAGTAPPRERRRLATLVECYELLGLLAYFESSPFMMLQMALLPLRPARRLGPSRELALCYANYACLLGMGKLKQARSYADQAVDIAHAVGDLEVQAHCSYWRAVSRHVAGDTLGAEQSSRDCLRHEGRYMSASDYINGCADLSWNLIMRGHFGEAREWVERALMRTRHSRGADAFMHSAMAYAGSLRALAGMPNEARAYLSKVNELLEGCTDRFRLVEYHAHRLLYHLAVGEFGEEIEQPVRAHRALAITPALSSHHQRHFYVFEVLVRREQCALAEREGRAVPEAALARAARDLHAAATIPTFKAFTAIADACTQRLAGRHAAALDHLTRADELAAALDAPWVALEAAVERARLHRQRGYPSGVEQQGRIAVSIARSMGWHQRIRALRAELDLQDAVPLRHSRAPAAMSEAPSTSGVSVTEGSLLKRQLEALLQLSLASASVLSPEEQARVALDEIVRIVGGERAFLFLSQDAGEQLTLQAGRHAEGRDLADEADYSTSIVETVRAGREPVVLTGTEQGEAVLASRSIAAHGLRSVLAVPLLVSKSLRGVLYVDTRLAKGAFAPGDADIVMALGSHITIGLETARAAQAELERTAMEKDLTVTAAVQSLLLPPAAVAHNRGLRLVGHNEPASHCGGDWWWYEVRQDGVTRVLIGDVTGHGVASAMVTAAMASSYRMLGQKDGAQDVGDALRDMDTLLDRVCRGSYLMTFSGIEIDASGRTLTWWNAGAPPLLTVDAEGQTDAIPAAGEPLGRGRASIASGTCELPPGSRVLAFSDGLVESPVQGRNRSYGMRRVQRLLRETRDQDCESVRDVMMADVTEARGDLPAEDDVTFVLIDVPD